MFKIKQFHDVKEANNYIKKLLAEIDVPHMMEFQLILSFSSTECVETGGNWESLSERDVFSKYLYDLDDAEGVIVKDLIQENDCFECLDQVDAYAKQDEEFDIYRPWETEEEIYVTPNSGLTVLFNSFALCENQFPVVVVKTQLWEAKKQYIQNMLKFCDVGFDYTMKISPALYVELFYAN